MFYVIAISTNKNSSLVPVSGHAIKTGLKSEALADKRAAKHEAFGQNVFVKEFESDRDCFAYCESLNNI